MSKHVNEWLNAYLDGELRGARLAQVRAHLEECPSCQAELESVARLSGLLHEPPMPAFTPPERFAAQVNLRLPRKQATLRRKRVLEIGWWTIPVGLLAAWVFIGTSFFVSDLFSAVTGLGLLDGIPGWLRFGLPGQTFWASTLGQIGVLSGSRLDWAASTEAFTRASLLEITLQISIALLYLSWIAIWWARQRRQAHSQLLES